MPQRSVIDQLPEEVREWLESELLERNFSEYVSMTDELNSKLDELGLEVTVSKSSLHRWGQDFESKVEALKRTTRMAQTIARDIGDDEGAMNDAVIRLVQDKMFATVLDENLSPKALHNIARATSDLVRASVAQKKHQIQVRKAAAQVADAVEKRVRAGGLSPETVEAIKTQILGIADAS